jgi:Glycosyl hydrolase family 115
VSYWGGPRDYLWLCSTPPALIAEEMSKAFDYGADKVWILNVGDLKPAELDIEFFLKLAWNPHAWNGTNTYDLLEKQLARDFGAADAAELSSILAEYYRLNSQRKPEHMGFNLTNTFSTTLNGDEVRQRLGAWRAPARRIDSVERQLPAESHDAFFELIGYPVCAAALIKEKALG